MRPIDALLRLVLLPARRLRRDGRSSARSPAARRPRGCAMRRRPWALAAGFVAALFACGVRPRFPLAVSDSTWQWVVWLVPAGALLGIGLASVRVPRAVALLPPRAPGLGGRVADPPSADAARGHAGARARARGGRRRGRGGPVDGLRARGPRRDGSLLGRGLARGAPHGGGRAVPVRERLGDGGGRVRARRARGRDGALRAASAARRSCRRPSPRPSPSRSSACSSRATPPSTTAAACSSPPRRRSCWPRRPRAAPSAVGRSPSRAPSPRPAPPRGSPTRASGSCSPRSGDATGPRRGSAATARVQLRRRKCFSTAASERDGRGEPSLDGGGHRERGAQGLQVERPPQIDLRFTTIRP